MNGSSDRTSTAIRWHSVEVWRSAACLRRTRGPCNHSGAASHPTRRPGASSLDTVPSVTARSVKVRTGETGLPRKRSAPYGSSSTITKP